MHRNRTRSRAHPSDTHRLASFKRRRTTRATRCVAAGCGPSHFVMDPCSETRRALTRLRTQTPAMPTAMRSGVAPSSSTRDTLASVTGVRTRYLIIIYRVSVITGLTTLLANSCPRTFSLTRTQIFRVSFVVSKVTARIGHFMPRRPC